MADLVLGAQHVGPPPWPTLDPFLFCVHHVDNYPAGTADMGPASSLAGRNLGQDFANKDGWNMYHGRTVPGFPRHPHRGFETITLARKGVIDHADSLGATARFSEGDVQWMTAGKGIQHCEMFPLRAQDTGNPAELFQLWINLPAKDKMVEPHFTMLWRETLPRVVVADANDRRTEVVVMAGSFGGHTAPAPPPSSWASDPDSEVMILTLTLAPGATVRVPACASSTAERPVGRALYTFDGKPVGLGGMTTSGRMILSLDAGQDAEITAGDQGADLLLLQGRAIGEPVAKHGPFVMNTREEVVAAYEDYRRTQFGGWPWSGDDPVHPREAGRFAVHAGGRREEPPVG